MAAKYIVTVIKLADHGHPAPWYWTGDAVDRLDAVAHAEHALHNAHRHLPVNTPDQVARAEHESTSFPARWVRGMTKKAANR